MSEVANLARTNESFQQQPISIHTAHLPTLSDHSGRQGRSGCYGCLLYALAVLFSLVAYETN